MIRNNLFQLLESSAQTSAGITFIKGEDKETVLSYRELLNRSLGLLHYLQSKGLRAGDQLILLVNSNQRLIDAFWACIAGGIIPVPLSAGISQSHREKILMVLQQLSNPYLYLSADNLNKIKEAQQTLLIDLDSRAILTDEIISLDGQGVPHASQPQDLAFIQYSSGSTSTPKGVRLTHQNLLTNIEAIRNGAKMESSDRTLGWMPLTHDMGLIGFHMVPLAHGIDQYLMPTELFVRRPLLWMSKVSEKAITLTCSPNFGYKHFMGFFDSQKASNWDFSKVRLILNGAEPISAELCREFVNKLKPYGLKNSVMFPVYGLAEACLAVTFPRPGESMETQWVRRGSLSPESKVELTNEASSDTLELVKLGFPVDFCTVQVNDNHHQPLPELTVGHVVISGNNVTSGYYNMPEATALAVNENGLDTGDLGYFHQGQLVICGRNKDIIFSNGQNYFPHDLEQIISGIERLELGKTAISPIPRQQGEDIAVFVLHKGNLDDFLPLIGNIRKTLSQKSGLEVNTVLPVRQIPKTTSGKIQRYQLSQQYAAGSFSEVEQEINSLLEKSIGTSQGMANEIEQQLLDICNDLLSDKSIGINDNLFELGTNSLVLTQIHDRIDEIWPGLLELTDYFDYPTISELAEYLKSKSR